MEQSGLFDQAPARAAPVVPELIKPRCSWPDPGDWTVTPGDLERLWGDMWAQVEEEAERARAQMKPLQTELASLKSRDRVSNKRRLALQNQIQAIDYRVGNLQEHYELGAERYWIDVSEVAIKRALAAGLTDMEAARIAELFSEQAQPVRPWIEVNHSTPLQEIWGRLIEGYCVSTSNVEEAEEPEQDSSPAYGPEEVGQRLRDGGWVDVDNNLFERFKQLLTKHHSQLRPIGLKKDRGRYELTHEDEALDLCQYGEVFHVICHRTDGCGYMGSCMSKAKVNKFMRSWVKAMDAEAQQGLF